MSDDEAVETRNVAAIAGWMDWTDDDLAAVLGVTRKTVYLRRRGSRTWSVADLRKIADASGFALGKIIEPRLGASATHEYLSHPARPGRGEGDVLGHAA